MKLSTWKLSFSLNKFSWMYIQLGLGAVDWFTQLQTPLKPRIKEALTLLQQDLSSFSGN